MHGRPAATMTAATTAAGIPQDRNVACNGKDDGSAAAQSARSRPRVYKIVVLGDGGVGKSGIRRLINLLANVSSNIVSVYVFYCNNFFTCFVFSCHVAVCQSQVPGLSRSYDR